MNLTKLLLSILIFLAFLACRESRKEEITRLVKEWQGKTIVFPENLPFTMYGKDTVDYKIPETDYKILVYVDSIGCTSCKLQLSKWKEFIEKLDSLADREVPVMLFFHPKDKKEIQYILQRDRFDHPICLDMDNKLCQLNRFPSISTFQTFLLDKGNKVIAIGNPIHNMAVKDIYLKQITGKNTSSARLTTLQVENKQINWGSFPKDEQKTFSVFLKNTGTYPLVILDTSTTCGCAEAQYDLHPAQPGDSLKVQITYTPKDTGYFEEWITVKCNTTPSTVRLSVKGTVL